MTLQGILAIVLIATLVERMRVTVIMIVNARNVTNVELTIAEVFLASILHMIVATDQKKTFAQLKILAEWIKVIVTQILSVWMDQSVDLTIAQTHLVMILKLIVVMVLLLLDVSLNKSSIPLNYNHLWETVLAKTCLYSE